MSDIFSVLQSGYTNAVASAPTKGTYVAVDPATFQGTWTGAYGKNNQKFALQVSNVQGFRAQVRFQSGSTVAFQNVLIKNSSFRVGDTKFTLTGNGTATVGTAVTDPISGNVSLLSGTATQA